MPVASAETPTWRWADYVTILQAGAVSIYGFLAGTWPFGAPSQSGSLNIDDPRQATAHGVAGEGDDEARMAILQGLHDHHDRGGRC